MLNFQMTQEKDTSLFFSPDDIFGGQSSILGSNSLKNVMSSPYCFIDWSRRLSSQTAAFWAGRAGKSLQPRPPL